MACRYSIALVSDEITLARLKICGEIFMDGVS
jgi:hypothetical protein